MNRLNKDEHKQRVIEAMRRYTEGQETRPAGRQRPPLRRKNNFVRGSMGIFCAGMTTIVVKPETKGASNGQ